MSNRPASASVAIIGAGPAGLMAAEILATAGHAVTIYDRMASVGRKFLMAGRGGLNLTHSEPLPQFLTRYGAAEDWLTPAITAFPPDALRAWAEGLGQETFVGSSDRVFPRRLKTSPLLRAWLLRLEQLQVRIVPQHDWIGWTDDKALQFRTPSGAVETVRSDATLLALGGASWPRLGSTGAWRDILTARDIAVTPFTPANSGFMLDWSENFQTRFAGEPLKTVAITHGSHRLRGEAMITTYGIEGGAVYALSAELRATLARDGKAVLSIDLRPDLTTDALRQRLDRVRANQSLANRLRKGAGLTPLAINLMREATDLHATADLAALIKAVPLHITGVQPLARAISSAGGIARADLDAQFMLRKFPGVFAAGEMLDWEAPTGGYLLQASFATAVAAAKGITDWLNP
ncbi:TIGR03862 family flavoprotein [Govanella unica]|uniref:TIGR03862 family flavoprotein n=1 Tax=Govanella unica TaxID=2975056 RepID=A0A9X3TYK9_9PROT|nr:TIGR03862 family flavoprotein [Govania unica]MDA5194171.1 TIGR03862 family flavoprotein [Govania unica]